MGNNKTEKYKVLQTVSVGISSMTLGEGSGSCYAVYGINGNDNPWVCYSGKNKGKAETEFQRQAQWLRYSQQYHHEAPKKKLLHAPKEKYNCEQCNYRTPGASVCDCCMKKILAE